MAALCETWESMCLYNYITCRHEQGAETYTIATFPSSMLHDVFFSNDKRTVMSKEERHTIMTAQLRFPKHNEQQCL